MKLALIGYGRMGQAVEALATARGHQIAAVIDPAATGRARRRLTPRALEHAEVCLEFTRPEAAADNVIALCRMNQRVVVGTTGWYDRLDEVAAEVKAHKAAVLYGANFSIGVNLFYRLVARAVELFGELPERDLYIAEAHHRGKADAPSGTARHLAEIVIEGCPHKSLQAPLGLGRRIREDELCVASIRAGWIPGTHRVGIESPHDAIVLEHQARSREGLAEGALRAAQWLLDAAPGLYRFEDVLDGVLAVQSATPDGD